MATPTTKPKKQKLLPKPIRNELIRLGFATDDASTANWRSAASRCGKAFWRQRDAHIRGFRFLAPRWIGRQLVLGQTPTALALVGTLDNPYIEFRARLETGATTGAGGTLAAFLANLEEDPEVSGAARTEGGVTLHPSIESDVLWALGDEGRLDVAAGGLAPESIASLRTLRLHAPPSLDDLDERFAALETLVVHAARLTDLGALKRLPSLRRLMLHACDVSAPSQIAELTQLTEVHLPGCRATEEQLGFLRSMTGLTACTVAGNFLPSRARAFVEALPAGIVAPDFEATDQLESVGVIAGAVRRISDLVDFPVGEGKWTAVRLSSSAEEIARIASSAAQARETTAPEAVRWWPAQRYLQPLAKLTAPEYLDALHALGVTFDAASASTVFPPGPLRLLERSRWPDVTFRSTSTEIALRDFRARPHTVAGRLALGTYDEGRSIVFVSGPDADLGVTFAHNIAPEMLLGDATYLDLWTFLRSLRRA